MNRIAQEARKRQAAVKLAKRKGKSFASAKYGVSLSSVKRWCRRYDGTWQSLQERSHRPHSHPKRHTAEEEGVIRRSLNQSFFRYGREGAYTTAREAGYSRSYSGFIYAARRMGLCGGGVEKKRPRKQERRYPELMTPGEKVQVDVKEVPYCCLRGAAKRDEKHLYQWTAISVKFLEMLQKAFPFQIQTIQTDNGSEFTYKYISETEECPFDTALKAAGIDHKLIPPGHRGTTGR